MTNGNKSRVKNQSVIDYLIKYEPSLINGESIFLGTITHNRLLEWDDLKELLMNIAVYALLRNDLRDELRNNK